MRFLCESFIPLLGLAVLWGAIRADRPAWETLARTILSLALVLIFMMLDRHLGWWHALRLDFSTHTGIAVALVVALAFLSRGALLVGLALLAGYAACMIHMGYHSLADIGTSAALVIPLAVICHSRRRAAVAPNNRKARPR